MCSLMETKSASSFVTQTNDKIDVSNVTTQNWQMWCRLCAKEDPDGNICVLFKNEQPDHIENACTSEGGENHDHLGLAASVEKYFCIQIRRDDKLPKMLCTECFSLVTSLVNFTERVVKVQQMFHTLKSTSENATVDTHAIRLKYGLLDDDRGNVLIHKPFPEVQYLEQPTTIHNKIEKFESGEVAPVENPLEPPRKKYKTRKSNLSTNIPVDDIKKDKDSCHDDEFPLDDYAINNLQESFVDDLMTFTKDSSDSSFSLNEFNDSSKEESKPDKSKKATPKKRIRRKKRRSSDANDGNKNEGDESGGEGTIPCTKCPRKFKRTQDLRCHMTRIHSETLPEVEAKCPECSRVFKTQYKLKKHQRTHLPDEVRKTVPCPHCEKKFSANFLLQIHVKLVHMEERRFVCEKCGVGSQTSAALKEHMLTHTDYAPFKCEVCEKFFKNASRLRNHMEIHNPEKHTCAKCGLQLNSRVTLNRHLLVHSDKMKHKCDYCGRAFKRAKTLKTHLIAHTGLKPYSCNFCDRTFGNGANCRSHKKKAHPEELAALEASGGKAYTRNIPKLAALKAITKANNNLEPVDSIPSGCFQFRKESKPPQAQQPPPPPAPAPPPVNIKLSSDELANTTLNTNTFNEFNQFLCYNK